MLDRTIVPKFEEIKEIKYLTPQVQDLDNGIKLYSFSSDNSPVVKLDIIFTAGIECQKEALQSVFANALIKEGPKGMQSDEVSEFFDFYGSYVEAFVGALHAGLRLYIPVKFFQEAIPVFAKMIKEPNLPETEFDIIKKKYFESIKNNLEKTKYVAMRGLNLALFGSESPIGYFVKTEDVEKLAFSDVKKFVEEKYKAENCHIMLSGKIDNSIISDINKYFGQVSDVESWSGPVDNYIEEVQFKESKDKLAIYPFDDAVQSSIYAGINFGKINDSELIDLGILNTFFGGYFGSRLMKNIREDKGYTYGIGSFVTEYSNAIVLKITSDVGVDVTQATIDEIKKEIEILRTELISEEEVELVRNYILGELISAFDGVFPTSSIWEKLLISDRGAKYIDKQIERLNTITPLELRECAIKYLKIEDMHIVVAGKIE